MITPDAIKEIVDRDFTSLHAERRTNPSGWSFFLRNGGQSARLAGVSCPWPGAPTFFRLAVSSRLTGEQREVEAENAEQVRELLREEIRLYGEHFGR